MNYSLENKDVKIVVSSFGAELKELTNKIKDINILWDGNPKYWKRNSPVLFPNVGKYKDGKFLYDGKEYYQGAHGFARDNEFELESKTNDEITFSFTYNNETLQSYPFKFKLYITYKLSNNELYVIYKVLNLDNKTMYFGIGGHPAFICPLDQSKKRSDYYLKFYNKNVLYSTIVNGKGLKTDKKEELKLENGYLSITDDIFKHDTIVLENQNISKISLCDHNKKVYVTVESNCPLYGIWGSNPGTPFVCIEPWFGAFDHENFCKTIADKEYENALEPKKIYENFYKITLD